MDTFDRDDGQKLILSEDIYNQVTQFIADLAANTGADCIIFCESNGYPVTHVGDTKGLELPVISSLAASNFSATAKMASLLGEKNAFKYLFHEGEQTNLYISNVGFNFLLLVLFDIQVALGMIRIYTRKTIESLNHILHTVKEDEDKSKQFLDVEFKDLLNEELNRSLKF
ncbi:MAG: roadblock/LC7 domain-containing protein [bacterium]